MTPFGRSETTCPSCGLARLSETGQVHPDRPGLVALACPCGWRLWGRPLVWNHSNKEAAIGLAASELPGCSLVSTATTKRAISNPSPAGVETGAVGDTQTVAESPIPHNPIPEHLQARDTMVPIETIIARVCRLVRVDPTDIFGSGRHKAVVLARVLIVAAARRATILSFPDIARVMGRPNHSTAVTEWNRYRERSSHRLGQWAGGYRLPESVASMTLADAVEMVTLP